MERGHESGQNKSVIVVEDDEFHMTYLDILIDSLKKKVVVLDAIIEANKEQKELFEAEKFEEEKLDSNLQKKSQLIEELNKLDDGFEEVFERVKSMLEENKATYADEINTMKSYIRTITDKSMTIQAEEERNKKLAAKHFSGARKDIRKSKTNLKVASQYYKNMAQTEFVDAQFMDKKK